MLIERNTYADVRPRATRHLALGTSGGLAGAFHRVASCPRPPAAPQGRRALLEVEAALSCASGKAANNRDHETPALLMRTSEVNALEVAGRRRRRRLTQEPNMQPTGLVLPARASKPRSAGLTVLIDSG